MHAFECLLHLRLAPPAPAPTHGTRRRHLCHLVSHAAPPNTSFVSLPPAGGISPVTRDFVNPERPWPHLAPLAQATAAAGRLLLPRLPLYPAWVGLAGDAGAAVGPVADAAAGGVDVGGVMRPALVGLAGDAGAAVEPSGGAGAGHAGVSGRKEAGAGSGAADEAAGTQRQGRAETAGVVAGPGAGVGARTAAWLDFSGGRESVGAAVLRSADSEGFLRASSWVAGQGDGVGEEADKGEELVDQAVAPSAVEGGQQGHGVQEGLGSRAQDSGGATEEAGAGAGAAGAAAEVGAEARRRSTPLPSTASVRRRPGGGWRVEVGADGAVAGVAAPGEPRPVVQRCGNSDGRGVGESCELGIAVEIRPGKSVHDMSRCTLLQCVLGGGGAAATVRHAAAEYVEAVLSSYNAIFIFSCRRMLDGVLEGGRPLQQPDIELLLRCRGADFAAVVGAADRLRRTVCGDTVSYVVNRNINYTNVCTYK